MATPWHAFKPTAKQRQIVEHAASFGVPQVDIAEQFDIDVKTLRKHFRRELNDGKFKMDLAAGGLFAKLMKDKDSRIRSENVRFYLARRMGWKETSVTENVGKDGGPIETRDVSALESFKAEIARATERLEDRSNEHNRGISNGAGLETEVALPIYTK